MKKRGIVCWVMLGGMLGGIGACLLNSGDCSMKRVKRKLKNKSLRMIGSVTKALGRFMNIIGAAISDNI